MELLQGSIAFALVLASLATVCTVLIEILHRVAGLRSAGLQQMLEAYFEDVLKPKLTGDLAKLRTDLMDTLTNNALMEKIHPVAKGGLFSWLLGGLYRKRLLQANSVTTEEFLHRLPDTEVFRQIEAATGKEAQALVTELAAKYDQYGAAASDYFKRRAQLLSLLMGIALALFANIHALRIFDSFMKNPDLAVKMEAQADKIKASLEQQPAASAGKGAAQSPDTKAQLQALKTDVDKALTPLRDYEAMGLPIGWNYYPNCFDKTGKHLGCEALLPTAQPVAPPAPAAAEVKPTPAKNAKNAKNAAAAKAKAPETVVKPAAGTPPLDPAATKPAGDAGKQSQAASTLESLRETFRQDRASALLWLFTVVVTGILIGLGGPFWFDLAMRLSQIKQGLSGGSVPVANQVSPRDQAIATVTNRLAPDTAAAPAAPAVPAAPAAAIPAAAPAATLGPQPWNDRPW